jgi:hypothetical protein
MNIFHGFWLSNLLILEKVQFFSEIRKNVIFLLGAEILCAPFAFAGGFATRVCSKTNPLESHVLFDYWNACVVHTVRKVGQEMLFDQREFVRFAASSSSGVQLQDVCDCFQQICGIASWYLELFLCWC